MTTPGAERREPAKMTPDPPTRNLADCEQWSPEWVATMVAREIERQDGAYGSFDDDAASVRLAVACLEDEVREVREAWQEWKRRPDWYSLRAELIQVAALAARLARDVRVEVVD